MTRLDRFAKRTQRIMRDALLNGDLYNPHLFRTTKRLFYHAVTEYGIKSSGLCSIQKPVGMTKKNFRAKYDIDDDHYNPPEFTSLYMFAHPEKYLIDTPEALKNMTKIFDHSATTRMVTGTQNENLSKTSGKIEKGIIIKKALCPTNEKYSFIGIDVLYNIKTGQPISVKDCCYVPNTLIEWEKKFWNEEFKFPMKETTGLLEEFFS